MAWTSLLLYVPVSRKVWEGFDTCEGHCRIPIPIIVFKYKSTRLLYYFTITDSLVAQMCLHIIVVLKHIRRSVCVVRRMMRLTSMDSDWSSLF
jgi:hypothetical protein